MIRIGDFSKLSRVSIKTLRYYDEVNLLKPVEVDRFTGYRYYEFDQLPRLHRILAFKDLGFSLEEIGRLLEEDLSVEQMRGMLKLRQAEIRQQVQQEAERLERVELWLRRIEQEDFMSKYDVVIKKAAAIQVASVRGVVPTPPEQGGLWNELEDYLARQRVHPVGPCFTLYHNEDEPEHDWDLEVCEPIADAMAASRKVKVYSLPAVETLACTVHAGPFVTVGEAYDAIGKWIDENGYQVTGPCREIYLQPPTPEGNQNDPGTVTEIQFPVDRA
ncbi:MAG: MerR family transcriptional regulator [Anaerolineales bacterium]|nr:MerR family transcriptional regulator [Anaerolineales bacterium]